MLSTGYKLKTTCSVSMAEGRIEKLVATHWKCGQFWGRGEENKDRKVTRIRMTGNGRDAVVFSQSREGSPGGCDAGTLSRAIGAGEAC